MGKDLAARFPAAARMFERIDGALGFPLSRVMFEGPEAELTATHNAQPAILAHSLAVHAALGDKLPAPAAALGHSLGEYSAYATAGAIAPDQAAKMVRRRGELMHEAGAARRGTMAVVLGLAAPDVAAACQSVSANGSVAVPANLNAPDQTVISGDPDAVTKAGDACLARGAKRILPLKVSGAFHSPLMAPAASGLRSVVDSAGVADPAFPVIANATAEAVTTAVRARQLLVEQLTAPVRFVECVQQAATLVGAGARFIEIGPGAVLAGLVKRIVPEPNVVSLGTADDVSRFLEAA